MSTSVLWEGAGAFLFRPFAVCLRQGWLYVHFHFRICLLTTRLVLLSVTSQTSSVTMVSSTPLTRSYFLQCSAPVTSRPCCWFETTFSKICLWLCCWIILPPYWKVYIFFPAKVGYRCVDSFQRFFFFIYNQLCCLSNSFRSNRHSLIWFLMFRSYTLYFVQTALSRPTMLLYMTKLYIAYFYITSCYFPFHYIILHYFT